MDVGALWGVRRPVLLDIPPGDPRLLTPVLDANGGRQCTDNGTTPTITPIPATGACAAGTSLFQSQTIAPFREVFLGDSPEPAPVDRLRRQLEFAFRPVPDRYCHARCCTSRATTPSSSPST